MYVTDPVQIFSDTFGLLAQIAEEAESDQEMLSLVQMGLMMVDWLDPTKTVLVKPSLARACLCSAIGNERASRRT